MKKSLIILCTLIVTGCSARQYINHNPQVVSNPEGVIKRVLQEQPQKKLPRDIEITDEYLQIHVIAYRHEQFFDRAVPKTITIYYDNMKTRFFQHRRWYVTDILDKGDLLKYRVYSSTQGQSEALMNALHTMSQNVPITSGKTTTF